MLGVIVSGVWLAILGEWGVIGTGLIGIIGGALVCSFLMLPGMALTFPGMKMWESGSFLARVFSMPLLLVGLSWTYVAMTAWAFGSYMIVLKGVSMQENPLPFLLWAYAVATAPWVYMLQKDVQAGNYHGANSVFFLQIACVFLIFGFWFKAFLLVAAFWLIMAVSLLVGILKFVRLLYVESRQ